jgi:hypothetical protein
MRVVGLFPLPSLHYLSKNQVLPPTSSKPAHYRGPLSSMSSAAAHPSTAAATAAGQAATTNLLCQQIAERYEQAQASAAATMTDTKTGEQSGCMRCPLNHTSNGTLCAAALMQRLLRMVAFHLCCAWLHAYGISPSHRRKKVKGFLCCRSQLQLQTGCECLFVRDTAGGKKEWRNPFLPPDPALKVADLGGRTTCTHRTAEHAASEAQAVAAQMATCCC